MIFLSKNESGNKKGLKQADKMTGVISIISVAAFLGVIVFFVAIAIRSIKKTCALPWFSAGCRPPGS
jgi:hypothetical protein